MSFDPSLPANGSEIRAAELRGQLNGLKHLIDALPAGQQGPPGKDGRDGVDGEPGQPGPAGADGRGIAELRDSGDGTGRVIVVLTDGSEQGPFTIASGPQGERGSDGGPGPEGPQGPAGSDGRSIIAVRDSGDGRAIVVMSDGAEYGPFTVASGPLGEQGPPGADSTVPGPQGETGPAGNDGRGIANVRDSGDGTGRCFMDMTDGVTYGPFTIATGPSGMNGNDGRGIRTIRDNGDGSLTVDYSDGNSAGPFAMPAGPQGPQGTPGEVSAQQLSDAIGGTSANSNNVQLLGLTVSDPPTQSELQAVANKLDELINTLRR